MASTFTGRVMRALEKRVDTYGHLDIEAETLHFERWMGASEAIVREAIELGVVRMKFTRAIGQDGRPELRRPLMLEEAL